MINSIPYIAGSLANLLLQSFGEGKFANAKNNDCVVCVMVHSFVLSATVKI